jgi:hypothetical protein
MKDSTLAVYERKKTLHAIKLEDIGSFDIDYLKSLPGCKSIVEELEQGNKDQSWIQVHSYQDYNDVQTN